MLKRVAIKGFRSCHDVVLDNLGPLTVLVGRNAVGKSNILRAISWLAETATSSDPSRFSGYMVPTAITARTVVGRDTYDYSLEHNTSPSPQAEPEIAETLCHEQDDGTRKEIFKRQGGNIALDNGTSINLGSGVPCMPAIVSLLPADSELVRLVRPLLRNMELIRYYPMDREANPTLVRQSEYNEWLSRRRGLGDVGDAVLMRLLDMNLTRPDEFNEVQQLLGQNGLGLIDVIHVDPFQLTPTAQNEEERFYYFGFAPTLQLPVSAPQFFRFGSLSSGTQRVIAIITSLVYDHSAVMLLEHPEDGIHRALLRKLIDVLQGYSDQTQLIIASHSAAVLNAVPPEAIRLVTMEDGQTKVRSLTPQETQAAAYYLEQEGTLAEFLELVAEG